MSQESRQDPPADCTVVEEQHAVANISALSDEKADYQRTTHPDAQWFPEAGLGMFIHWGIASVNGKGDLSWGMWCEPSHKNRDQLQHFGIYAVHTQCTPVEYWKQAEHFLCEDYDPNRWLAAAREAGVKYAVLTTKHHDGFCLWPSNYGEFNTKKYLNGRDLVGEFVQACRANDIKVGFYYSPPDWYFFQDHMSFARPGKPPVDKNHQPYAGEVPTPGPAMMEEHRQYANGHVRELLTRYGKVDILWFDGRLPEGSMSIAEIRELQPGILVNPRGHGYGDFNTPECRFPTREKVPDWWEYCHVFSDGAWGYQDHEAYKPIGWFLEEFSKARAWNGNWLPNVGPDSRGRLPEVYYRRMEQLKEWMAHSAESVIGTTGGNWPEESNVPITHKGNKTYAHVAWTFAEDCVVVKRLSRQPQTVKMLKTGNDLPYQYQEGVLTFSVPANWRTHRTDVVAIEC